MRDRLVIATKGRFPMGDGPNDAGLSRTHLGRALDASLRRLGIDAVDLYQAHAWDPLTPIEETLGFFDDAVRAGKIRYAGVSNFVGWQLQKAALLAGDAAPIVTLQPQYNLLVRDIELEIVDVCRNEGIGILPWSPLAGGWLTGKYARDERPTGATRLGENPDRGMEAYGPRNAQERTWRIIDAVRKVAEGRGVSMSQVALAWVADRPAVTSVILGARTVAQLDDNLGAADLQPVGRGDRAAHRRERPADRRLPLRRTRHRSALPLLWVGRISCRTAEPGALHRWPGNRLRVSRPHAINLCGSPDVSVGGHASLVASRPVLAASGPRNAPGACRRVLWPTTRQICPG